MTPKSIFNNVDSDTATARREVLTTLRVLQQRLGGVPPNDPLAAQFEEAITALWKGAAPAEIEEVSREYRAAFGHLARRPVGQKPFDEMVGTDGWFADFLRYTCELKTPPQLLFGAVLTMIGAAFGRRPLIEWVVPLYPNLYVLLIGSSATGKGTAIRHARRLVSTAVGLNVLSNDGTPQGYMRQLAEAYKANGCESSGLIVSEEFKVLFSRDRNKEGLVEVITDWFDSADRWDRGLAGGGYELTNVCVSMLGASTMTWLRRIPEDAILSGFFPRYIMFGARETDERWGMANPALDPLIEASLIERLQAAFEAGLATERVKPTAAADQWLEWWHAGPHREEYEQTADEHVRKWYERKQAAMMKMAFIWQVVDGAAGDLQVPWLQKARAVLDWSDQFVQQVYGRLGMTAEGEVVIDVLEWLRRKGGALPESSITRGLRYKYRADRVRAALHALRRDGDVTVETGEVKKGMIWRIVT